MPAARAMESILLKDATASFFQYADDTQVHVDPEHLGHAPMHLEGVGTGRTLPQRRQDEGLDSVQRDPAGGVGEQES